MDEPLRTDRYARPDWSGERGEPPRPAERFPRNFVAWRAHLAAPGSRFTPALPAPISITQRDTPPVLATATPERRTA
jgi:hypothetical protein